MVFSLFIRHTEAFGVTVIDLLIDKAEGKPTHVYALG